MFAIPAALLFTKTNIVDRKLFAYQLHVEGLLIGRTNVNNWWFLWSSRTALYTTRGWTKRKGVMIIALVYFSSLNVPPTVLLFFFLVFLSPKMCRVGSHPHRRPHPLLYRLDDRCVKSFSPTSPPKLSFECDKNVHALFVLRLPFNCVSLLFLFVFAYTYVVSVKPHQFCVCIYPKPFAFHNELKG